MEARGCIMTMPGLAVDMKAGGRIMTMPGLAVDMKAGGRIMTMPGCHSHPNRFSRSVRMWPSTHHPNSFKLNVTTSDLDTTRPLIHFPPSLWGHRFLSLPSTYMAELDALKKEIDELKPKVREMLIFSPIDDKERIRLIHLGMSLGFSYHFENEIEESLKHAFGNLEKIIAGEYDLYTISVMFQVFRLYKHPMSSDVFDRFKDEDGKFRNDLKREVKAMVSLYEASYLGTPTEDIMDEAMSFTKDYLESSAIDEASLHLQTLVKNALHQPRHRNMEILLAKEYISFYEQEEDHDDMLLKFAKLNFKHLQLHYIQELETVSKWWKDQDLASKLPYFRDRIVECYFSSVGAYVEPQYSYQRITMAKLFIIATVVDDSCDAYGTLPEVAGLVHGFQRWDFSTIDKLPDYMKIVSGCSLRLFTEIAREVRPPPHIIQDVMEEVKIAMRASLDIAKWARAGQVPTFDEYMEVAVSTTGLLLLMRFIFMGMEKSDGERLFEWITSRPKILYTLNTMFRLSNDKATHKHETSRGEVANGINCYMKQCGVTEEDAVVAIQRMYDHSYKVLIEEFLNITDIPRTFLSRILNTVRIMDVIYKDGDGYTYPQGKIDKHIISLFVDLIQL